jgi:hypothetical protein
MLNRLDDTVSGFKEKFAATKRTPTGRFQIKYDDVFQENEKVEMWKFINRYLLKSSQRSQWLERCGIRFMGQGKNKIMLIEANTTLTLSAFPNKATEFDSIWDCESGEKRKADKTPTTTDRVKRSRHGGGPCSVKPFKEQHPDSRRKIVMHLSKVAIRGIRAELRDVSSENVHAVTLAVSSYLRRELTKYCTDDSVLHHASVMMTRLYGKSLTCEVSMYMKGIRRLGFKIAERGSIVELYGLSNLTRSIRTCEEMAAKYQNVVTRLSSIIESNDIDALAISDANGEAPNLTDQQHKKLRLQAMTTILICTNLVDRYSDQCLKIEQLIDQMRLIQQDNTLQGEERSLRIELLIEVYNKYRYTMKVENSLPRIIGKVHNMLCQDKYLCRTITDWFNQYMASDNKGWRMDMRGCHERHCFLTEAQYDLESKLELFMQLEKSFSVEKCTEWLNGHIQHLAETHPHLRDIVVLC